MINKIKGHTPYIHWKEPLKRVNGKTCYRAEITDISTHTIWIDKNKITPKNVRNYEEKN